MAKFLLFLLLISLRIDYVYAQYNACYCTTTWYYNQTFGQSCTANADCWACQPGAYNQAWQQAFCGAYQAPTCQTETQTQVLACQAGYTGQIIKTKVKTCPSGTWTETTQDSCVKSLTNPTNVTSPVSPVSPANPTFSTSVTTTPSAPATAPTSVQTPTTATGGLDAPTTEKSVPQLTAPTGAKGTEPKISLLGKTATSIVLTQELIVKPNIVQYNAFPTENISQELPSYVKIHDSILLELLGLTLPNQDGQFKGIIKNTLEIEQ